MSDMPMAYKLDTQCVTQDNISGAGNSKPIGSSLLCFLMPL